MLADANLTSTPSDLEKYDYIVELLEIGARYKRYLELDRQLSSALFVFVLGSAGHANKVIHIRGLNELKALKMYSDFMMNRLKDRVQELLKSNDRPESTARRLAYVTAVYLRYVQPVIDYVDGNDGGSSRYLPTESKNILVNFVGTDSTGKVVGKIFATTEKVFAVKVPESVLVFENSASIIKSGTVNDFVYRGICVLIGVDYNKMIRERLAKGKSEKGTANQKGKQKPVRTKAGMPLQPNTLSKLALVKKQTLSSAKKPTRPRIANITKVEGQPTKARRAITPTEPVRNEVVVAQASQPLETNNVNNSANTTTADVFHASKSKQVHSIQLPEKISGDPHSPEKNPTLQASAARQGVSPSPVQTGATDNASSSVVATPQKSEPGKLIPPNVAQPIVDNTVMVQANFADEPKIAAEQQRVASPRIVPERIIESAPQQKRPVLRADIRLACEKLTEAMCRSIRMNVTVPANLVNANHAAVIGLMGGGHDQSICNAARMILDRTPQFPVILDLTHIQSEAIPGLAELAVARLKPYLPEDKDGTHIVELIREMILAGEIKLLIPQTWRMSANQFNLLVTELRRTPRWAIALENWNMAERIAQDVVIEWMPKLQGSDIYTALMELPSESLRLTAEKAISSYQNLPAARLFIDSVIITLKKTHCHAISLANVYLNNLAALVGWPGKTQDFADIFAAIAFLGSSIPQNDLSIQTIHNHFQNVNLRIDLDTLTKFLRYAVRADLMDTKGEKFRFEWPPFILRDVSGIAWARLFDIRSPEFWLSQTPADTVTQGIIYLADTGQQSRLDEMADYLSNQLSIVDGSSKSLVNWAIKSVFARQLVKCSLVETVREIDKVAYVSAILSAHVSPYRAKKYQVLADTAIEALKSDVIATVIIEDNKPSAQWESVSKRATQLAAISSSALSDWIYQLLRTNDTTCQELGLHFAMQSQDENILESTETHRATRNTKVKRALIECWCIWHARLTDRTEHENRMTELYDESESELKRLIIANLIAANHFASVDFAVRLAKGSTNLVFNAIGQWSIVSSEYVLQTAALYARQKLAQHPKAEMRECLEMLARRV